MATYDVTAQTRRVQFTGDGTAGPFAFSFQVNLSSDIKVYVDSTVKTETTHYTVSINSSTGAGTVSFTTGNEPTSSQTITILGSIPFTRTSKYTSGGQLTASSLEDDFDTNMFIHQQTNEEIDRSLRVPEHDTISGADMTLPAKANRVGKLLGFNSSTGNPEASFTIADGLTLSGISSDIATLADIEDGTDATDAIQTVAGIASNVTTVAGKASLITSEFASDMALIDSTFVSKMSLVTSDFVSDMSLITADVVADLNTLATSDIVSDLNTLATSDIVSDLNTLATSDIVSDINTLATSDIVSDLNTLATSAIVADLNILATSDNVTNMATLGASGVVSNIATVAGVASNVTTVANNISGVNSFAERYRIGSSDPSSNNDEGDLFYNTSDNTFKFFNGSAFVAVNVTGIDNVVEDTTPQLGGNLDINGNDIVSTSNADIDIVPNGTGNVTLQTDTVQLGSSNEDVTVTTNGTGDLTLNTNSGTDSGSIVIADGANQNVTITPNGTGKVVLDGLSYPTADGTAGQFLKTDGSGALSFDTVSGTTINNNANNRVITGSGTANTLEGEANFTFDGSKVGVGASLSPSSALHVSGANNNVASQFYLTAEANQTFKLGANGANLYYTSDHSAPTLRFNRGGTGTAVSGTTMFWIDNNNIQIRTDNQATLLNGTRGISKCWHTGNSNTTIDSHNVSGYTDHGTGQQTVTISHNYANANYCISFGSKFSGTYAWLTLQNNPGAGSYRFTMGDRNGGVQEGSRMMSMTMGQSG